MKLSIVSTLYYSAPYIQEFYIRIKKAADKITNDYEIIFVNDGSPDESLETAKLLLGQDDKIKIIDLSRNFGHHRAIMTGLAHARGEYVFLIDSDLEEEPESLSKFYAEIVNSKNYDVVFGVQARREGGFIRRISGAWAYVLFNILSPNKIPENLMLVRLMTRRYVDNLIKFRDKDPLFSGLCALTGFNQKGIKFTKPYKGKSTYSIQKRLIMLANAVVSFSSRPLVLIFLMGLIIVISSIALMLLLLYKWIFLNIGIEGWVLIMISIWFLGGVILSILGFFGIYLYKIINEVKERPFTVIRNIYSNYDNV